MNENMPDILRIAKRMVRVESDRDDALGSDVAARWWASLVVEILDALPPGTAPRISSLVINYLLGDEDGEG